MTKRIIAFVASLAVIIGLMNCGSSYAWFVTTLEKKQNISVSVVSTLQYANVTDLESDSQRTIMPGDNLVNLDGQSAMLRINNGSSTDVQIRVSVEYTSYASGSAEQKIYSGTNDDIEVTFAANKWAKKLNADGVCYYYYMADEYVSDTVSNTDEVPAIGPEISTIDVISSIVYKDDISKAYLGKPVNVKVKFESKQADNVTWNSIESYQVSGTSA